jgi:tetratricopeptide (TPR) repeat protein
LQIIRLSVKISKCQKALLNYEEALVVLKTCWKNIKKKHEKNADMLDEFLLVANEYISILILMNRFEEAHDLVAEALGCIQPNIQPTAFQKKITSLVISKAQIFYKLGYLEDAYDMFSKVQAIISNGAKRNDLDIIQSMQMSEAVDYIECVLGVIAVDIELSNLDGLDKILDRLEGIVQSVLPAKDSDQARKIKILRLAMCRDLLDFNGRNTLADQLANIYQRYDHYRLVRCEDFMQFVRERVLYLIDNCKHDFALLRVENILSVLSPTKAEYWYNQFRLLQARCLTNLRKATKAYDILQDILQKKVLAKDKEANKLRDNRLFLDLHLELSILYPNLGDNYLAREDLKNSYKCIRYAVIEYFQNEKIFSRIKPDKCLRLFTNYLDMANIERKMSDYPQAQKHLKYAEEILKKQFKELTLNMLYGSYLYLRSKINADLGDINGADADMNMVRKIYSEHVEAGAGDFATIRLASALKDIAGSLAAKDKFTESLQKYKEAFTLFKRIYPNELYRGVSALFNDMANVCISFKKYDLAMEYIDKAMIINSKLCGEDSIEMSTNYHTLGNMYSKKIE